MKKLSLPTTKGLLTGPKRVGMGEQGFFLACKNVVPKDAGLLQQREARTIMGGIDASKIYNRMFYDTIGHQVFACSGSSGNKDISVASGDSPSSFSSLSTNYIAGAHIATQDLNLFLTDKGVIRQSDDKTLMMPAGIPAGTSIRYAGSTTPGWLGDTYSVGYYTCLKYMHPDGRIYRGQPSGRQVIADGIAGFNPTLRLYIPYELKAIYDLVPLQQYPFPFFLELYRTEAQPPDSTTGAQIDPGREALLVYSHAISATDITSRYITYTDTLVSPNGEALYTNPSQEGLANANLQPPLAIDTTNSTNYGHFAVIGNTIVGSSYYARENLSLTFTSVHPNIPLNNEDTTIGFGYTVNTVTRTSGSPTLTAVTKSVTGLWDDHYKIGQRIVGAGIPAGTTILGLNKGAGTVLMSANATSNGTDTITLFEDYILFSGDNTYYAGASYDASTFTFGISSNLGTTAEGLVALINETSTKIYAQSLSDSDETAGLMYFEQLTRGNVITDVTSLRPSGFMPNGDQNNQWHFTSEGKGNNVIAWCKEGNPLAWPAFNTITVPNGANVTGLSSLRGSIIVWTDRGTYIFSGVYGNYGIEPIDLSSWTTNKSSNGVLNIAGESVGNTAICLTTKGLTAAAETEVRVASNAVGNMLASPPAYYGRLFVNRSEDLVYIPLQNSILVWSAPFNCWTYYDGICYHGVYSSHDNRMYFSLSTGIYYSDLNRDAASKYLETLAGVRTISSIDTTTKRVTFSASIPGSIAPGDALVQGSFVYVITAVNSSTIITLEDVTGLTASGASLYNTVSASITFCPIGDGGPSITKQNQFASVVFDGGTLATTGLDASGNPVFTETPKSKYVTFSVTTNLSTTAQTLTATVSPNNSPDIKRFIFPQAAQRCSSFTPTITFKGATTLRLASVDIDYETVSQNVAR